MDTTALNVKKCGSCEVRKPHSCFNVSAKSKDGRESKCLKCKEVAKAAAEKRSKETAEEKTCCTCKKTLPLSYFNKDKSRRYGVASSCRGCAKGASLERNKKYRENNLEKVRQSKRDWSIRNPEYCRGYYEQNKARLAHVCKAYREKNKATDAARRKKYKKQRLALDPLFNLKERLGTAIRNALRYRGYRKKLKTIEVLGCDWATIKAHIESQFVDGMSWDNRSEWHIDHVMPLASAKTEEDLIKLNHYTNLRPLWAFDNMSKGARIINN